MLHNAIRVLIQHPRGQKRARIVIDEESSEEGRDPVIEVTLPDSYRRAPPLQHVPMEISAEFVIPKRAKLSAPAAAPIIILDEEEEPKRTIHDVLFPRPWTPERIAALQARLIPGCNARHPHPLDAHVSVDFSAYTDKQGKQRRRHWYFYKGERCVREQGWFSGSAVNDVLWEPFDADGISQRCAKTKDPTSEYFGKTAQQIKDGWEQNADHGTSKHASYDTFMQGLPQPADELPPPPGFYCAIEEMLERHGLQPYRTEWAVADALHKLTGQIDIVFIDEDGLLHLGDWKNCKDEDLALPPPGDFQPGLGRHPFTAALVDKKYNHYRIQLSIYWWLLTAVYGMHVSRTIRLFNFRPADPWHRQILEFEPLDMAPLVALLPWNPADPRHSQFPVARNLLGQVFADDDPRALNGPTTRIRAPKGQQDNVVWTGSTYTKNGYQLEETRWKHPWRWFGAPPITAAGYYEAQLLQDQDALCLLPSLVGKSIACWCEKPEWRCHADVLVKYANLHAAGAFKLPRGPGMGMFSSDGQ